MADLPIILGGEYVSNSCSTIMKMESASIPDDLFELCNRSEYCKHGFRTAWIGNREEFNAAFKTLEERDAEEEDKKSNVNLPGL